MALEHKQRSQPPDARQEMATLVDGELLEGLPNLRRGRFLLCLGRIGVGMQGVKSCDLPVESQLSEDLLLEHAEGLEIFTKDLAGQLQDNWRDVLPDGLEMRHVVQLDYRGFGKLKGCEVGVPGNFFAVDLHIPPGVVVQRAARPRFEFGLSRAVLLEGIQLVNAQAQQVKSRQSAQSMGRPGAFQSDKSMMV